MLTFISEVTASGSAPVELRWRIRRTLAHRRPEIAAFERDR